MKKRTVALTKLGEVQRQLYFITLGKIIRR